MPTILHTSVDQSLGARDAVSTFNLVLVTAAPAFTTYYWSAALQRGAKSVVWRSGLATSVMSGVLWWPALFAILSYAYGWPFLTSLVKTERQVIAYAGFLMLMLSIPVALLLGFLTDGLSAMAGAAALEFARSRPSIQNWQALLMLLAALIGAELAMAVLFIPLYALVLKTQIGGKYWLDTGPRLVSLIGWVVGLAVSGFPKILHTARLRNLEPSAPDLEAAPSAATPN